jgi:lipid-binding SYLF domain-containing protein
MIRLFTIVAAFAALAGCASQSPVPTTQAIVNDAKDTVEALKASPVLPEFATMLKEAKGVAIFPELYKGAFIFGAEGGHGVVLARDEQGEWSYPAFYSLASGSWGLQLGGQRARTVLLLRSPGAVQAIMEHQGKLGADLGLAVAAYGTGIEGATTTNLGPDIVAFNDAMGLYGGVSLEGSAIVRRNDFNQDYYAAPTEPKDVLVARQRSNPGADALRASLSVP